MTSTKKVGDIKILVTLEGSDPEILDWFGDSSFRNSLAYAVHVAENLNNIQELTAVVLHEIIMANANCDKCGPISAYYGQAKSFEAPFVDDLCPECLEPVTVFF